MAKAKETFHIFDPEQSATVLIKADETIPSHLVDKVGKHLGGNAGETEPSRATGEPAPAEGSEEYEAALEEAYQRGRTESRDAETAAYEVEGYGSFDPTADGVGADQVKAYLTGLDRDTVAGAREFQRVTDAEVAGANRKTALVD